MCKVGTAQATKFEQNSILSIHTPKAIEKTRLETGNLLPKLFRSWDGDAFNQPKKGY